MVQFILGVIIGAIAGTLAEAAKRAFWGPRICTEFRSAQPEFKVLTHENALANQPPDVIYVRLKVINHGHDVAKNCYGYLVNVEKYTGHSYESIGFRDSIPLCWSYLNRNASQRVDVLQGVPQYLDIFSTSSESQVIQPRLVAMPNVYSQYFNSFTLGKLKLSIVVSGEGVAPQRRVFEIEWKGDWQHFVVQSTEVDAFET